MAEHQALKGQIEALAQLYQDYDADCAQYIKEHSGLEHVGEWIFGNNKFAEDRIHTDFHEGVKKKVAELNDALSQLDAGTAQQYALEALSIIVDPIEEQERHEGGWMRFATETVSQPLLIYLDYEHLKAFSDRYNDFYPKRLQFPNQVKYRKAMEALLKKGKRK